MRSDSGPSSPVSSYAAGSYAKPPSWHWLVVFDVWLNNLTTGLFLVTAFSELTAPNVFASVARVAYPIAFVLLVADLVLLVLDLGDPWRFHHMLRVFKPSSPMSLGTWCLTVYSLPLLGLTLLSVLGMRSDWLHSLAVIGGIVPALGTAIYKGVLFSTSSQPGWKDARWLGSYLTSSSFMLGCAQLIVISVFLRQDQAIAILRPTLTGLLLLNVVTIGLLLINLRESLRRAGLRSIQVYLGIAMFVGGLLAPLMLIAMARDDALLLAIFLIGAGTLVVRYQLMQIPLMSLGREVMERPN